MMKMLNKWVGRKEVEKYLLKFNFDVQQQKTGCELIEIFLTTD
jgi:hypothetical protein